MPGRRDLQKGARVNEEEHTRALYNGFGNTLSRAFELVVTPSLFALIGHFVDRWLGTRFAFAVSFGIFCLVGMSIRMFYGYVEAMKAHEAEGAWGRPSAVTPATTSKLPARGARPAVPGAPRRGNSR
jgi:hypothetical protein